MPGLILLMMPGLILLMMPGLNQRDAPPLGLHLYPWA